MKTHKPENEQNILFIKNKILDNIALATIPIGVVASFFTYNRDLYLDFKYATLYAIANFASVGIIAAIYLFRKKVPVELKVLILSTLFFLSGLRALIQLGSVGNPYIVIAISFLILQLLVNRKWMITLIILAIGLIIIEDIIFTYNPIFPELDYGELVHSGRQVGADILMFTLLVATILLSNGKYNKEILNSFRYVKAKNKELDKNNKLLNQEIKTREKYEQEVLINTKKFQMLFESSHDGIILSDQQLNIIEVNPSFCDLIEYPREELVGVCILDILSPKNKTIIMDRFYRLLEGEIQPLTELDIHSKNGEKRIIEFSSNLIIGAKNNLTILTTIRNVSSRKEMEEIKFNAVLEAEENERERFSKDLHDELGPLFSTVKLYVESLKSKEKNPENEQVLDKLSEIVNDGVRQIREISHNLSPLLLREKGLMKAIDTHIKRVEETSTMDIDYDFSYTDQSIRLSSNTKILVYRVFLELMNNSIKHSGATKVIIKIIINHDRINFVFSDNGVGFDPNKVDKAHAGIGLKNIMNRIKAINGEIVFSFDKLMRTEITLPI